MIELIAGVYICASLVQRPEARKTLRHDPRNASSKECIIVFVLPSGREVETETGR